MIGTTRLVLASVVCFAAAASWGIYNITSSIEVTELLNTQLQNATIEQLIIPALLLCWFCCSAIGNSISKAAAKIEEAIKAKQ